jgi:hypothetical protein
LADVDAGATYLSMVTPEENAEAVVMEAKAGTLTREKLVNSGVSHEAALSTPQKEDRVDVAKIGSKFKEDVQKLEEIANGYVLPSETGTRTALGEAVNVLGGEEIKIAQPLPTQMKSSPDASTQPSQASGRQAETQSGSMSEQAQMQDKSPHSMLSEHNAAQSVAPQVQQTDDKTSMQTEESVSTGSPMQIQAPTLLSPQEQTALSPVERISTLSNRVQALSDEEAGVSYVESVTPAHNIQGVLEAAKAGILTRETMIKNGVSGDIAGSIPVNEDGTVTLESMGASYKEGISNIEGVMKASEQPTIKYGGGLGNTLENANMSQIAAMGLQSPFDLNSVTAPVPTYAPQPTMSTVASSVSAQAVELAHTASADQAQVTGAPAAITRETVVDGAQASSSNTFNVSGSGEMLDSARSAASPGNIQTQNSDIKKAIDEVSQAMDNAKKQVQEFAPAYTPGQLWDNKFALGDFANGMALNAPVQTNSGELTFGNRDGFLAIGPSENPFVTNIPAQAFASTSEETREALAATLSGTKLNNADIAGIMDGEDTSSLRQGNMHDILFEMNASGKRTAIDQRLESGDQISLLEDLAEIMESIESSVSTEIKKEI